MGGGGLLLLPPTRAPQPARGSQMQPLLCTRRDSRSLAPQDRARCCPAKQCRSGLAHRPTSPCSPTEGQGDQGRCPRSRPEGDHQQQGILGGKPEGQETSRAKKQEGRGRLVPAEAFIPLNVSGLMACRSRQGSCLGAKGKGTLRSQASEGQCLALSASEKQPRLLEQKTSFSSVPPSSVTSREANVARKGRPASPSLFFLPRFFKGAPNGRI